MKANIGSFDKVIRIILAIIFTVLYFTKLVDGTVGIVLLVLSGILLLTSMFSFCPLYTILGLKTTSKK
jgi:uncharacterized membrane protein YgaE (UPF0421/DUF939 family)